ncbi:hypothetical protein VTG60DRAFT_3206 [Thermothelomyces hinnuleus]
MAMAGTRYGRCPHGGGLPHALKGIISCHSAGPAWSGIKGARNWPRPGMLNLTSLEHPRDTFSKPWLAALDRAARWQASTASGGGAHESLIIAGQPFDLKPHWKNGKSARQD